jgi:quercetin dioxygenase-like cupin family protein
MPDHKIDFDAIPWAGTSPYSKAKAFVRGNRQVRIVEFAEGFTEPDWCRKGHTGYVLEGAFSIDFNGETERFEKGDSFYIPQGEEHRHMVVMGKGEKAVLLLVEDVF